MCDKERGGDMIRRAFLAVLAIALLSTTGFAQEAKGRCSSRRGDCAGYGSRDATVLSMMGWGLFLGIGIATLCALIPNSSESAHGH